MNIWDRIGPELTRKEFYKPDELDEDLLWFSYVARIRSGVTMRIVSSFRDEDNPEGVKNSTHKRGLALDARLLDNYERFRFTMALATCKLDEDVYRRIVGGTAGFSRLGLYIPNENQIKKYGKRSGSIHWDNGAGTGSATPRLWMKY